SFLNYDLSRIINGFGSSGASTEGRFDSVILGLKIFQEYPLFGSGVGHFFERVYESRYLIFDGFSGLIDPHNMYILILSEMGLLRLFITFIMIAFMFYNFSFIKIKALKYTAYITLLSFLLGAMGGTHLFINASFATVFWIYMGTFNAVSLNNRGMS